MHHVEYAWVNDVLDEKLVHLEGCSSKEVLAGEFSR